MRKKVKLKGHCCICGVMLCTNTPLYHPTTGYVLLLEVMQDLSEKMLSFLGTKCLLEYVTLSSSCSHYIILLMQSLHYPPHAITALSSSCSYCNVLLMQSLHYPPHAVTALSSSCNHYIILLMQSLSSSCSHCIILLMQSLHYPPHAITTLSSSCNHYIILLM